MAGSDPWLTLAALQALVIVALALLLRLLYARLRPEELLRWWQWAFSAHGVALATNVLFLQLDRRWDPLGVTVVLVSTLAAFTVIPLLVFGALAMEGFRPTRSRWLATLALALTVGSLVFLVSALQSDPQLRFTVRHAPRMSLLALACFYCAAALWRQWRRSGSPGAFIVTASLGLYGAAYLLNAGNIVYSFLASARGPIYTRLGSPVVLLNLVCELGLVLGVALIVLEQAEASEGRARAGERRYSGLVENANDIIFATDRVGAFTALNRAGEQILGYTREEALRLSLEQLAAPEHGELARRIGRGEASEARCDLAVLAKDGRRLSLEVSCRPIVQNDTPGGTEGIARDITERKSLEEQLRESQKMDAIGRLAGGVAHDFNNLLTVITGYTQMSIDEMAPEHPARPGLEHVARAAERAAALIGQLLAFSRRQVFRPRMVSLNGLLEETVEMLRPLVGETIELEIRAGSDAGSVRGDPACLQQVILNLAANARDAMPQGGRLILETALAPLGERPGAHAMLAVSDTGHGMEAETLARVFEPFFTTKELGKGTGLGLATVYGIVKQHEGDIEVSSRPGAGTTFRIYLPSLAQAAPAEASAQGQAATPRGAETILVVEDEAAVRRLITRTLEASGYRVIEAPSAEEALQLFPQHAGAVDLLLTDLVMPGLGGQQLADRLAAAKPALKVLYISGYDQQGPLPGAAFLQKPFTPGILAGKLREVLDRA